MERLCSTCKATEAEVHVLCDCLECCIKHHSLPTKMYQTMATTLSDSVSNGEKTINLMTGTDEKKKKKL